jgi:hypothetical protein
MSFLILPHSFNPAHIHFGPIVKNNDSDGNFSRIVYSTKDIAFNGIGIMTNLHDTKHECHYKKMFIRFDPDTPSNLKTLRQLQTIETAILQQYVEHVMRETCHCIYSLAEQLQSGCIKAYTNDATDTNDHHIDSSNRNVMLKICGVWETNRECGILYKFINY